jgi:FkbM family methyltransferase
MHAFQEEFAKIKAEAGKSKAAKTFDALKPKLKNRPLVLYGAGRRAGAFLDLCRERGIEVTRFCDRSVTGDYEGIEIIDPDTLKTRFSDAFVVVCSCRYRDEIHETVQQSGFPPERIVPCPTDHPCFNTVRRFDVHLNGYEWAYDLFEDEDSKQLVLDRLRLILCERSLVPNTQSACYYEEGFIVLGVNEVFVDAGAYTGDSAEEFIEKFGEAFYVHAFEPDPVNYGQAVRRLSRYPNITITQKGLWSVETELVFAQNAADRPGSSFVFGTGSEKLRVPVTSLDGYFDNTPESKWPTFIKMDIEGAEKEALLGAAKIIERCKPKLAICAYHKPEDIYELPQTILGLRDDYGFALRQHAVGHLDTVLYAV